MRLGGVGREPTEDAREVKGALQTVRLQERLAKQVPWAPVGNSVCLINAIAALQRARRQSRGVVRGWVWQRCASGKVMLAAAGCGGMDHREQARKEGHLAGGFMAIQTRSEDSHGWNREMIRRLKSQDLRCIQEVCPVSRSLPLLMCQLMSGGGDLRSPCTDQQELDA